MIEFRSMDQTLTRLTRRARRHSVRARRVSLAALAAAGLALGCGGRQPADPAPQPPVSVAPPEPQPEAPRPAPPRVVISIADSIFLLTNRERTRADLTPLRHSAQLARAAQIQAEQMASAKKLAHEIPGTRYPTMASRLRLVTYTARAAGENVAEGYTSAAALVAGWMMSPTHRANILSPRFTETGVGTARSKAGRTYHAQLFGRPADRPSPTRATRPSPRQTRAAPR
jgi:uncharacterized protein YkwD